MFVGKNFTYVWTLIIDFKVGENSDNFLREDDYQNSFIQTAYKPQKSEIRAWNEIFSASVFRESQEQTGTNWWLPNR